MIGLENETAQNEFALKLNGVRTTRVASVNSIMVTTYRSNRVVSSGVEILPRRTLRDSSSSFSRYSAAFSEHFTGIKSERNQRLPYGKKKHFFGSVVDPI